MLKASKTRREDLIEARDRVQRQIEILEAGPASGDIWARRSDTDGLLMALQAERDKINEALAELGPDNAR
ncbi:MAG TPA: hypothetical protein VN823_07565 [Stellaceae bacterium]|nr:hypothetical protein [Stellaceae bacterium]